MNCCICLEIINNEREKVVFDCNHFICGKCMSCMIKLNKSNFKCPQCRKYIVENKIVYRTIYDLLRERCDCDMLKLYIDYYTFPLSVE